jgi:hypothetical protein
MGTSTAASQAGCQQMIQSAAIFLLFIAVTGASSAQDNSPEAQIRGIVAGCGLETLATGRDLPVSDC